MATALAPSAMVAAMSLPRQMPESRMIGTSLPTALRIAGRASSVVSVRSMVRPP
nr:hypothetical protein [Xaviernesmea oryzae]